MKYFTYFYLLKYLNFKIQFCLTFSAVNWSIFHVGWKVRWFSESKFCGLSDGFKNFLGICSTGWPGCLVLKQGAVNQLILGVFLMFLACLDHARWAKFHLGILGPQEWKKSSEILSWKKVRFQDLLKLTFFWFPIFLIICP